MIGAAFKSRAIQAVLGPAHSARIPENLWVGWLNGSLGVLSMTGGRVPHSAFGPVANGVANTAIIDGGLCPATVPTYFGLFNAKSGGDLIAYAAATFASAPSEDDVLTCSPGQLVFTYEEA